MCKVDIVVVLIAFALGFVSLFVNMLFPATAPWMLIFSATFFMYSLFVILENWWYNKNDS